MRRDLFFGAIVSLGLHYGIASFNPAKTERVAPPKEPDANYIGCTLKPEDPIEETPRDDSKEKPVSRDDLRPPSQIDVPQVPRPESFPQVLQPPNENKIDTKMATIPTERIKGSGDGRKIYDPTSLDQQPVAKFQAKPVYPFEMRRSGESGEVLVDFIVDQNGEVRNVYAVRSTHREFEAAAVQAVSKWKFRPGKKAGVAVGTHMQVPIMFRIGEGE